MKYLYLLLLLIICFTGYTQDTVPCNFKTQGEQEDCWAKQKFEKEYVKKTIDRYQRPIELYHDSSLVKFGNQILQVNKSNDLLVEIFTAGILYPELITGRYSVEEDSILKKSKFYQFFRNDTLLVSNLEELKFLNSSMHVKRFRFWVFRKNLANPTVYFFELTNNTALSNTGIKDFIKGSILTYFSKGWTVL